MQQYDKKKENELLRKLKVDKKSPIYHKHIFFKAFEEQYSIDFYIEVASKYGSTTTKRPLSNSDVFIVTHKDYIKALRVAAAGERKVKVSDYPMYFTAINAKTGKNTTYMTEASLCELLKIPYRYTEQDGATEAEQKQVKVKHGMAWASPALKKIDKANPLYHKLVVFAGAFPRGAVSNLKQTVSEMGGFSKEYVSRNVDYLVLANTDYSDPSKRNQRTLDKLAQADRQTLAGHGPKIISEDAFIEMIAPYIQ